MTPWLKRLVALPLLVCIAGCTTLPPYEGVSTTDPRFERGMAFAPLDFFGDLISKPYQLFFWNSKFGNRQVSSETEAAIAEFLDHYEVSDIKIRINQWAPHKELARLFTNKNIAWPYRILFFPSTLITSLLGRPFAGLIFSDYFDPGSNTIHIFSDSVPIGLHEAGHAWDYSKQELKGTYSFARSLPGVDLFQERMATEEAIYYLEETKQYDRLLNAYKILYPAYATYIGAYISASTPAAVGALLLGHFYGYFISKEKKWQLEAEGKLPAVVIEEEILSQETV